MENKTYRSPPISERVRRIGFLLMLGSSLTAWAELTRSNSSAWKEEALLHDGGKIVVERSVEFGGRHELGQKPPIKEQRLAFTLPGTNRRVVWVDHYSKDLGSSNFNPLLLDVVDGTVYVLVSPAGCPSFNKWGRPNPPYVVFKYDMKEWKRVSLQALPEVIKVPNLVISSPAEVAEHAESGLLSADMIQKANGEFSRPEFRSVLRDPVHDQGITSCEKLVRYKCGWGAPGEFSRKYFERICK